MSPLVHQSVPKAAGRAFCLASLCFVGGGCAPDKRIALHGVLQVPARISHWDDRRLDGVEQRFRVDGSLIQEGVWRKGLKHGPWNFFDEQGRHERSEHWVHGERSGVWTEYHSDGSTAVSGAFTDGVKHGPWTFKNPDGATSRVIYWERGTRQVEQAR